MKNHSYSRIINHSDIGAIHLHTKVYAFVNGFPHFAVKSSTPRFSTDLRRRRCQRGQLRLEMKIYSGSF